MSMRKESKVLIGQNKHNASGEGRSWRCIAPVCEAVVHKAVKCTGCWKEAADNIVQLNNLPTPVSASRLHCSSPIHLGGGGGLIGPGGLGGGLQQQSTLFTLSAWSKAATNEL